MKKSNLKTGIYYVMFGCVLLFAALLTKDRLASLLFGISCACILPGIMMIGKYVYWSSPEHKEQYEERLAKESIELHDELKVALRDKSGRYAYILGLITIAAAIVVFSVLDALNICHSRMIVLFLSGYLIFQYAAGIVFFKHLLKKY